MYTYMYVVTNNLNRQAGRLFDHKQNPMVPNTRKPLRLNLPFPGVKWLVIRSVRAVIAAGSSTQSCGASDAPDPRSTIVFQVTAAPPAAFAPLPLTILLCFELTLELLYIVLISVVVLLASMIYS